MSDPSRCPGADVPVVDPATLTEQKRCASLQVDRQRFHLVALTRFPAASARKRGSTAALPHPHGSASRCFPDLSTLRFPERPVQLLAQRLLYRELRLRHRAVRHAELGRGLPLRQARR